MVQIWQEINIDIPPSLVIHGTMMFVVFAVLFPWAYFNLKKRPLLLLLPWTIFNIGYLVGDFVHYRPVNTRFHRKYQILLVNVVNVSLTGHFFIRYLRNKIPRLAASKLLIVRLFNFLNPFALFVLSMPQMISGFTALFAIECVENEKLLDSIGHMVPFLIVFYLILLSVIQSVDIEQIPLLSLEKIISWVYTIGGSAIVLIIIVCGYEEHNIIFMGIYLLFSGVMSLLYDFFYLNPNNNPIVWPALSGLGILIYNYDKEGAFEAGPHKLCGASALLASLIRIIQHYGILSEEIKHLSEFLLLFSATFFLSGMKAFAEPAESMGINISAYASMVVAATLILYAYFIMLAYLLSSENAKLGSKKKYIKIDRDDEFSRSDVFDGSMAAEGLQEDLL